MTAAGVVGVGLAFLAAAAALAAPPTGDAAEKCVAPFLELHSGRSAEGRVDRQTVLAQSCGRLHRVGLLPWVPAMLLCGDQTHQRATQIPFSPTSVVVVLLDQDKPIGELEATINWLVSSNSKSLWVTHFVIWTEGDDTVARSILRLTWKYRILKAVVAVEKNSEVNFYKTTTDSGGVCEGENVPDPTLIGSCRNGELEVDVMKMKDNNVKDLKGCMLKVSTFHFPPSVILIEGRSSVKGFSAKMTSAPTEGVAGVEPIGGIEVQIVRAVAKSMNFSALFYLPPDGLGWGVGLGNGSFSGLLGELAEGRAEMGIGCLMPLPIRHKYFVMSRSYGVRGLAWAVPLPKLKPQLTVLVEVFTPTTWMAVAAVLVAAVVAIAVSNDSPTDGAFLYVWATTLGVSVVDLPRAHWTRFALLGWLLAFLVLSAAYQGALFSFLAKPRYEKALDTLEDIVLDGLPLVAHPNFNEFLQDGNSEISAKALKLFQPTADNVVGQMVLMAEGGKEVACLVNKEMLVWYNYEKRHNGTMVHIAKELATSFPTTVFMKRNTALASRVNVLISRLVESGLVEKWYTDLTFVGSKAVTDAPQVMQMHTLNGVFLAQGIGLFVAIFVFFAEILIWNMRKGDHAALRSSFDLK